MDKEEEIQKEQIVGYSNLVLIYELINYFNKIYS